ncbi:PDZ domain-containing protein [Corynebacterium auriscanis]|uniref:YlbL family protein n=1 Tax=Corynebacterium auriscanis TaxID=99807 RepID=UPI002245A09C|nr:PDZ domain-containing protein [Corynebacterium auriscanis]MCX2162281.1 PDZ domain-containing protein [Corynebacterium auriscanis]
MSFWNRRNRTVVLGAVPVVVLASLVGLPQVPGTNIDLTVPYAAQGKGPTFNTLGNVDGKDVVEISGAEVDKTSGNLNMTTVAVRTNMTLAQALGRWIATDDTLVPIEQVFPSGVSPEQVQEQNNAAFAASESNATSAAMKYLNRPMETMVVDLSDKGPAKDVLEVNDVITEVGGEKITVPADLAKKIGARKPGETVKIKVLRHARTQEVEVKLAETPKEFLPQGVEGPKAFLGVTSVAQPAGDVRVNYNLNDIGGPSAGLMFSLAVVDKLSPGELTGGKFIAGTGTIDSEGNVGPIGGITHKIAAAADAGAKVFLVPEDNCAEAVTIPDSVQDKGIKLVKVDKLTTAVDQLNKLNAGEEPQVCTGS